MSPNRSGVPGVIVLDTLDAAAVHRWSRTAVELLEANRSQIDALNVFPVADGDTGTNMLATLRAADAALQGDALSAVGPAVTAMARGAALGAIGNSGFILSQILQGLAEAVTAAGGRYDAASLASGLDQGARLGWLAVVTPVEGTILSVARAAADAAASAAASVGGATLAAVVSAAVSAADAALQRTTSQLADLAEAGVVDAGGRGLVLLLDALARTVTGAPSVLITIDVPVPAHTQPRAEVELAGPVFGFEIQYLLDADATRIAGLRAALDALGDSVALVPTGPGTWKVHVHVDDVGAAVEAGIEAGRPHQITVVHFGDQISGRRVEAGRGNAGRGNAGRGNAGRGNAGRGNAGRQGAQRDEAGRSVVVAVAPGAGLAHLFESEGVHVVDGTAGTAPSVDAVTATIEATGVNDLVLLPNAPEVTAVAHSAAARARETGRRVAVVPTRSPVQGLAAIAVHDPNRRFDDDVVAMAEAAAATRFAQVTIAESEALTAVGICQPGDVLGLIDGDVVEIGRGMLAVAFGLVDRLLGVGAELMTILVGVGAPTRAGELIEAHVRGRAAFTDVSVYQGGQPDDPIIIGVE